MVVTVIGSSAAAIAVVSAGVAVSAIAMPLKAMTRARSHVNIRTEYFFIAVSSCFFTILIIPYPRAFRNSLFAKFTEYGHRILHNVVGSLRLP